MVFFEKCINECPDQAVQCLVGFGCYGTQATDMRRWFLGDPMQPSIATFANDLVATVEKELPQCDGISFDIENLVPFVYDEEKLQKVRSRLSDFYQAVAKKMDAKSKVVGIATAGLVSDEHSHYLYDAKGKRQKGIAANAAYRVHDFRLGIGYPNILIRPMAYDNFDAFKGEIDDHYLVEHWHRDIVDYAVGPAVNLPASQFQLGIKTIPSVLHTVKKRDGTEEKKKYGAYILQGGVMDKKCRKVLRPNKVGLIFFPVSANHWQHCDKALNRDFRAPDAYKLNEPWQAPLDDSESISRAYQPRTL
jgi:hypothetical protein